MFHTHHELCLVMMTAQDARDEIKFVRMNQISDHLRVFAFPNRQIDLEKIKPSFYELDTYTNTFSIYKLNNVIIRFHLTH